MKLLLKCLLALLITIGIHFIAKTKSCYLSGLILGCPALSMLAYYFMYTEQGVSKVRETAQFALFAVIPFSAFLYTLQYVLKKRSVFPALVLSESVWLILSLCTCLIWHKK